MARRHNTVREPSKGPARYLDIPQSIAPPEVIADATPEEKALGAGWVKGQLLNVRNTGDGYVITLEGEEYDRTRPDRALRFTNPGDCQNFVSNWYAREPGRPW
jgi:hypothetical protein